MESVCVGKYDFHFQSGVVVVVFYAAASVVVAVTAGEVMMTMMMMMMMMMLDASVKFHVIRFDDKSNPTNKECDFIDWKRTFGFDFRA